MALGGYPRSVLPRPRCFAVGEHMELKHWEIHGSIPPPPKYTYRPNKEVHVLALNIERAIILAQRKFPGLEVFTAVHRGKIDIIEEKPGDFPELIAGIVMG